MSFQEAAWRETQSTRRPANSINEDKQNESRKGTEINEELTTQSPHSPFTQAVLYPILPNQ
ncbi:hypothetical protein GN244_ATG19785 [Phytophthora infestans]|nr:hypothetical protein GN244_ATG19785 [Phytophthora infestans]